MSQPCDLLVRNTTVLAPDTTFLPAYDLAIRGERIAALAPTGTLRPEAAARVIDGAGRLTMPGLINSHAHSAMVLFRGAAEDVSVASWFNDYIWRMELNLTPEDVRWGMRLAAAESIRAGVTTVADHYPFMDEIATVCEETGLRAHLAPTLFGEKPEEDLARARAFVERWHGAADGRIRAWLGPHSPYLCSKDFLKRVVEEAGALGVGVHLHVSETAQQVAASLRAHGLTPPRYLETLGLFEVPALLAHAAHATADDIAMLGEYGAGVAHCPKTFLKLAAGIADVAAMVRAGIWVGLGTDGPASNNSLDIFEAMRLTALLQKHERGDATVLPRHEALRFATQGGAAAVGQSGQLGRLEVGALADVILLRLDGAHLQPLHDLAAALVYSASAADVDTVIVNGRVLMEGRRLLTIDEEEVIAEVAERAPRLAAREGGDRLQVFPGSELPGET